MNDCTVRCHGLHVQYREQDAPVLVGVKLDVASGEKLAIMGPSGCGKSTLLVHLAGLRTAESGEITVCQQSLNKLTPAELDQLHARTLGFVFQRACLLPYLDVRENIELAFDALANNHNINKQQVVDSIIDSAGLRSVMHRRAAELSVGEAQRVAVARALVKSPPLLIADEPTGSLDGENVSAIAELLCSDKLRTVIIATHDERVAARCQRILHLRSGVLHETP